MSPDGNKPATGRGGRKLGVRVADPAIPDSRFDVTPDGEGRVAPNGGGMSVAPGFHQLPVERIPPRFRKLRPGARGNDRDRIWRHGVGSFTSGAVAEALVLRPDRPGHGLVEPVEVMLLARYEQALAATAEDWVIDEP